MNKKVLDKLADTLNIDAKILAKSLESEDSTIDLPKIYFESDITTLKENIGKESYDDGARVSREKTLKELSDLAGFEERVKDKEGFIQKFKENILADSSIEPNKKVEELNKSLENLQKLVETSKQEYDSLKKSQELKETKYKVSSILPDVSERTGLTKDEATSLFFSSHEIKEDGIYKNGEKVKGEMENSLSLKDTVNMWVSEKGWNTPDAPTGRGGKQKPTPSSLPKTLDEFETLAKEKGYSIGSSQYNALLSESVKENPELVG